MYTEYDGYGNWDFRGEDTKDFTHCFHIYPAMMIPQIARNLIKLYGKEGDLLFDPYCGSGTSLVEGRLAGMDVSGTDLNPTARIIARAKSINYDLGNLKKDMAELNIDLLEELTQATDVNSYPEPEHVTFERLKDWFPEKSIAEVSHCLQKIRKIEDEDNRLFHLIALSECLRLISFQRNGEFKLYRIEMEKRDEHYVELYPLLQKRLQRNYAGLEEFQNSLKTKDGHVSVHGFNTVTENGEHLLVRKPDIVVTSPPYGDSGTTVAYAQFSWLTNVWLGLDGQAAGALDRSLMGGRKTTVEPLGCKPMDEAILSISKIHEKRATEVMHFYSEYFESIRNVASIVNEGGYACYVVGNRTVKGIQLPTDQFTAWAFEQCEFEYVKTYLRDIPNKRMPSKNSPSNKAGKKVSTMHKEYLVVVKKKKGDTSRSYSGDVYPKKIETTSDLNEAMEWLIDSQPFPGARDGNSPTNVGETIEAALGQPPSTKRLDFKLSDGAVELKSGRQKVSTPLSLGTRILNSIDGEPYSGKSKSARFQEFVKEFAYVSTVKLKRPGNSGITHTDRLNLYPFLNSDPDYNSLNLYTEYYSDEDRIWIKHGDRKLLFYDQEDIDVIYSKLKRQYYLEVIESKIDGTENQWTYDVVKVNENSLALKELTCRSFFDLISRGIILINLRAHICDDVACRIDKCTRYVKSGGSGKVRDHNTGIRIEQNKIKDAYTIKQLFPSKK